jgi:hypothetical protein
MTRHMTTNSAADSNAKQRRIPEGTKADPALRGALGAFAAAVVRLDAVDAITTEMVRMRCASHHDCGL